MKRLVLLFAVVMLFAGMASAEFNYGMRMGISIGNVAMDPEFDEWGPTDADNKMMTGVYLGAWGRFVLNEKMSVLTGLTYIQKGDKYTIDGDPDIDWFFWGKSLEVPILFSYMISDSFEMYAGPVLGYLMKAGYKQQGTYDEDNITEFMGLEMGDFVNRFEFAMAAGMKYHFAEKYFGELGYEYGFTNMIDSEFFSEEVDFMTRTLYFGVGFSM